MGTRDPHGDNYGVFYQENIRMYSALVCNGKTRVRAADQPVAEYPTMPDDEGTIDLDAAVIQSLTLLTRGHASDFFDNEQPPAHIETWVQSAEPRQVRGLLMITLRRWHELSEKEQA